MSLLKNLWSGRWQLGKRHEDFPGMPALIVMKFHEISVIDGSAIHHPTILVRQTFRAVNIHQYVFRVFDRARFQELHIDFTLGNVP